MKFGVASPNPPPAMSAWNDTHYTRAQEFTRLLADALATAAPPVRPAPLAPPNPTLVAPPAFAPSPVSPALPSPAGATAANVFKKIPWKK